MRISCCCTSRLVRACCSSAASVSPTFFSSACWIDVMSLRPSAIIRVSSCRRV